MDVSDYLIYPGDAVGVIILCLYNGVAKKIGLRKNGSTSESQYDPADITILDFYGARFCGIDSSNKLEYKIESGSAATFYIIGEFCGDAVIFDDPIDITESGNGWLDTDITAHLNEGDSGNVALALVMGITYKGRMGVRENGSTNELKDYWEQVPYFMITGVDSDDILEQYNNTNAYAIVTYYLVGYLPGSDVVWSTDIINSYSITTPNTWTELDISGDIPANAEGVIIILDRGQTIMDMDAAVLRSKGSDNEESSDFIILKHFFLLVFSPGNKGKIEYYTENETANYDKVYVVGYLLNVISRFTQTEGEIEELNKKFGSIEELNAKSGSITELNKKGGSIA